MDRRRTDGINKNGLLTRPHISLASTNLHCYCTTQKMPANDQTNETEEHYDDYDDDGKNNHWLMFVSFWLPHEHLLTDVYFFCLSTLLR
jgi:hypothetical protein